MTTDNILAPVALLSLPDAGALTSRAQTALAFIEGFVIDSQETFSLAGDELRAIKVRANALEEQRTGITGPINTALKGINALFRGPSDLLARAEEALKRKMLGWQNEQAAIANEARRKALEAAEAERRRLEAEAAEHKRQAEEAQRAAAAAAAAGDAQAASAAQAAADRSHAEAQTAAATAQIVTAPVVTIAPPKAAGISTSKKLDFDVTSLRLLVAYIATGKVYEEGDPALAHPELLALLTTDDVRLRAYVRGLGMACALPGVRVFGTNVLSARAA